MKWPGRFTDALTNATEVFSYYSSGDSVFHETEDPPWLLEGMLESNDNYCWQKQETLKGFRMPAGTAYGGWGFNPDHTVPLSQNTELLKTEYTDEEMVTSPPFLPFAEDWLHSTNAVTTTQIAEVRDRILADGIPALTFAAGANEAGGATDNYNYNSLVRTPSFATTSCRAIGCRRRARASMPIWRFGRS